MQQLISVPAKDLLNKCKCREDIINICRELGNFKIYKIFL